MDLSCVAEVPCGLAISALTSSSPERIVTHERRLMATARLAPVRTATPALLPPRLNREHHDPQVPDCHRVIVVFEAPFFTADHSRPAERGIRE